MKVALGQFAAANEWRANAATATAILAEAKDAGCALLVLPEGILARDIADPEIVLKAAQPLDGPFMTEMLRASEGSQMTTMFCLHVPVAGEARVHNVLVALRDGEIVAAYKKLHLYDAFSAQESEHVMPGASIPDLVEVDGFKVGLMTCYDVRFPELARRHAVAGADILVLPAAWVKGPGKEHHWETLVTARALENTCYMVAVGECGPRNIGASMVVDPLGVTTHRAGETPTVIFATIDRERIAHARATLPVLANRRFAQLQLA
ncbi:deaminated glutathione amidase [uncultured Nitratireductor sp.]|uniref:deaminated glutathione amidase n=1 Tax=uncultured Nitratireductor sp. TaxID=520953 RepID=UPI0025E10A81|nr:deaminated glutathione amidase [uncultured Nitratireductor sp.]